MFCHAMSCSPCPRRRFAVPFLHIAPPLALRSDPVRSSRRRPARRNPVSARIACAPVRGRGRVSAPARFAHLIARARRRTHLARPFPPGSFSRPPAIAFCRNAERRPRKPPLSTFIIHHTAKCQARPGTKNESSGHFSRNAGGNEVRTRHSLRRRSKRCSMKAVPMAGAARLTNGTVISQATTMPASHIR